MASTQASWVSRICQSLLYSESTHRRQPGPGQNGGCSGVLPLWSRQYKAKSAYRDEGSICAFPKPRKGLRRGSTAHLLMSMKGIQKVCGSQSWNFRFTSDTLKLCDGVGRGWRWQGCEASVSLCMLVFFFYLLLNLGVIGLYGNTVVLSGWF